MVLVEFALAILQIGSVSAQQSPNVEWRFVYRGEHGDLFVDPSSLRRDGDTFTITQRLAFAEVRHEVQTMIVVSRFDCVRRKLRLLRQTQLDPNGAVLHESDQPAPYEHNAPAGGPASAILSRFCPH